MTGVKQKAHAATAASVEHLLHSNSQRCEMKENPAAWSAPRTCMS